MTIVVTLHKFVQYEETVFEDNYFWGTMIEDEAISSFDTEDGGEGEIFGHPANNYLKGPDRNGFTAHYMLEIGVLSAAIAREVWEQSDKGGFVLARWHAPDPDRWYEKAVWYDTTVHTDRLHADAPPMASAVTRSAVAADVPAHWPRPTVVADPTALQRFLEAG